MHSRDTGQDVFFRVNDLHVNKNERLRIAAYMHDGELIGEFLSGAYAGITHAGHGLSTLAHDVKELFVHPLRH